jgi:hypothetical protein
MTHTNHDHHIMNMDRATFLAALQHARSERDQAIALLKWGERLLPYLNANPDATLEQAIDDYKTGQPAERFG